jgi:hypothetical protein
MGNLTDRQQILYEWLQSQHTTTIEEIGTRLGISPATAYRDARALVEAGLAQKTNRGIRLPTSVEPTRDSKKCAFCGGILNERSAFVFYLKDGTQRNACCPHCGLLALDQLDVTTALASDFLYGRMVNARQATFLLESTVSLCCEPSVLCFANEEDARLFQIGFGGTIAALDQAAARLKEIMSIQK